MAIVQHEFSFCTVLAVPECIFYVRCPIVFINFLSGKGGEKKTEYQNGEDVRSAEMRYREFLKSCKISDPFGSTLKLYVYHFKVKRNKELKKGRGIKGRGIKGRGIKGRGGDAWKREGYIILSH
jgi:hypothetical protein